MVVVAAREAHHQLLHDRLALGLVLELVVAVVLLLQLEFARLATGDRLLQRNDAVLAVLLHQVQLPHQRIGFIVLAAVGPQGGVFDRLVVNLLLRVYLRQRLVARLALIVRGQRVFVDLLLGRRIAGEVLLAAVAEADHVQRLLLIVGLARQCEGFLRERNAGVVVLLVERVLCRLQLLRHLGRQRLLLWFFFLRAQRRCNQHRADARDREPRAKRRSTCRNCEPSLPVSHVEPLENNVSSGCVEPDACRRRHPRVRLGGGERLGRIGILLQLQERDPEHHVGVVRPLHLADAVR